MKKILTLSLFALAAAMAVGTDARATLIDGNITFIGGVVLDNAVFSNATGVSGFTNASVLSVDGNFVPWVADGDAVTFPATWLFESGPVAPFWSVGGFSFNLTSSSVSLRNATGIVVDGSGWITGNGFEETAGLWSFSTNTFAAGGKFSFSAASTSVPDNGASIVLLGLGLVGVGAVARRRKTA